MHDPQDFFGHRGVYDHPAKGNAARLAIVQRSSMAGIAEHIVRVASVPDGQPAAAASAPQQTGQESRPPRRRADTSPPPHVRRHRLLDAFKFLPAHIPFMRMRNEDQPVRTRFASRDGARFALFIVEDPFAFAVRICAPVHRAAENAIQHAVGRSAPRDLAGPRRTDGQLHSVLQKPP